MLMITYRCDIHLFPLCKRITIIYIDNYLLDIELYRALQRTIKLEGQVSCNTCRYNVTLYTQFTILFHNLLVQTTKLVHSIYCLQLVQMTLT